MNKVNKIYILAGAIILLGAVIAVLIVLGLKSDKVAQHKNGFELIAESGDVVLMADTGLDIEWLVDRHDGRRQIFERLRLVDKTQFEGLTGTEATISSIDISQANAEVFLTYPDGTREDVASDKPYVPFSIFPSEPAGKYTLSVNLNSEEEYEFEFEFKEPRKVELVNTGQTRIVEGEDKIEQQAYSLNNLDLSKATSVFHVTPENGSYGGRLIKARELAGIDKYFWLDAQRLQGNYEQIQKDIDEINAKDEGDRTPTEIDFLKRTQRPNTFEHIFLAKVEGVWHYAVANYPF